MKKISIIGIGKLGICLALNLEKSGFNVLGVDTNKDYIDSIKNKKFHSYEPFVNDLLLNSKNFNCTTNLEDAINFSDIIFLMVATPSLENGKYDHRQIESVILQLENLGRTINRKTLTIGCTTFPGFCQSLVERLDRINYSLVYNPEFISQGNIINGQLYPDMVLVGESDQKSGDLIEEVHKKLCKNEPKINRMSLTEAELTKLSINCFITTKISFANMIGDLCNKMDLSHQTVLNAIGSDSRINNKYLNWGYGFGGPCFPRDNRALGILCNENLIFPSIPKASDEYNNLHLYYQLNDIEKKNYSKQLKIDGVSYKKGSNLIIESQQLKLALNLIEIGFSITIIDEKSVIEQVKEIHGDIFKYEIKN